MKILLTGGHGFIGSNVVKQLVEANHDVRCLVRKSSDTSRLNGLDWEPFVGDVRAADLMLAAADGCEAIIHLASPSSWNDINSPYMKQVVEDGTRNVLEAAKTHGGLSVVYCSSVIAINGTAGPEVQNEDSLFTLNDPSLVYAMSKNAAEKICEEYAGVVPVMTVCPAEVYGPYDTGLVTAGNLIDFAKSNPVLVTRGGTSVAHVEDVARGVIAALHRGKPGSRYILGGDNLSLEELAQLVLELVGKKSKVLALPTPFIELFTKMAVKLHMPLPYNPLVVPYATKYWFVDNNRAKSELGVEFRSARETLEPTIAWLKEMGHI